MMRIYPMAHTWLELNPVLESIEDSRKILAYDEDYDGEGSKPVKEETWNRACEFLLDIAAYCAVKHDTIIDSPDIGPLSDGGLDIEWHTDNYGLLLMIPENGNPTLYGDRYVKPWKWGDGKPPAKMNEIKKEIDISQVDEELAKWLVESAKFNSERGPAPEQQTT